MNCSIRTCTASTNASSPKLDRVRLGKDVQTYDRNGIVIVRATGERVSLITEDRLGTVTPLLCRFLALETPGQFSDTPGRALNADPTSVRKPSDAPNHYFLCPQL
jgi:hypothetical protein